MNHVLNTIITRRSCKKYKTDMIPREAIEQIIQAGLYAANGKGMQSPIIIAVTEKKMRDELSRLNAKYDAKKRPDPFYGAPVVLTVLADRAVSTAIYDGSLVIGNMLIAAHSLNLGSCWVHRAKEVFEDKEGQALLKALGIKGDYEGIGHCVIGYPEITAAGVMPGRKNRVYWIGE